MKDFKKLINTIGYINFSLRVISIPFFIIALIFKILYLLFCVFGEFISRGNELKRYLREIKREFEL